MGVGFILETGLETLRHTVDVVDKVLVVLVPVLMLTIGFLQGLFAGLVLGILRARRAATLPHLHRPSPLACCWLACMPVVTRLGNHED